MCRTSLVPGSQALGCAPPRHGYGPGRRGQSCSATNLRKASCRTSRPSPMGRGSRRRTTARATLRSSRTVTTMVSATERSKRFADWQEVSTAHDSSMSAPAMAPSRSSLVRLVQRSSPPISPSRWSQRPRDGRRSRSCAVRPTRFPTRRTASTLWSRSTSSSTCTSPRPHSASSTGCSVRTASSC